MDLNHLQFLPGMQLGKAAQDKQSHLLYRPYMDFLWSALSTSATGLKCEPLDRELRLQKSQKGRDGAEIHNWLLSSDRLHRIRFTYFDAGNGAQAFNSLLYPHHRYVSLLSGSIICFFFCKYFIVLYIDLVCGFYGMCSTCSTLY